MFTNFCYSLNLSCSSFNFCNFFLNYFCNFSTRLSLALILETKNDWKLLIENKNKKSLWCLPPSEMLSPFFIKWCFTFHFRADTLMTYTLFRLFDIYRLLLKFILTSTWAIINTCWPTNFMDVALSNSNGILEYDDLVYSTLHIPSRLCWVILSTKFCYNVSDLFTPQSNNCETI